MRLLPTSLTLVGFPVAAGLAGCGSDAPGTNPGGTAGGSNSAAGATTTVPGAGAAGKPNVATAGSGGVAVGNAGSGNPSGGSNSVAGAGPSGGSGNTTSLGGSGGSGNNTNTGGKAGSTGSGGSGSDVDQLGKTNAKPGSMTGTKFDYLKMGEIRLINNNWGSVALNCTAPMSVFINADKSFGWSFDRGACNDGGAKPDFPQLEFGIHPFGLGSADATSPNFSSTTVLPLQIKDITTASVTLTDLKIEFEKEGKWDISFEFWLSSKDPGKTQGDAGVYSELMTFWGWEANRWPETGMTGGGPLVRNCNPTPCKAMPGATVTAGKTYKLEVQDDAWGKWRYFQFRDTAGSSKSFNGTVDVKKLIDYLVNTMGYSKDLWVSRLEVGAEIGDGNKGKVTIKNVEFEVNGQKRSPVFGQ